MLKTLKKSLIFLTLIVITHTVSYAANEQSGVVTQVKGGAWIKSAGKGVISTMRPGARVVAGDTVRTFNNNSVQIAYDKTASNLVEVQGSFEMVGATPGSTEIKMTEGKLLAVLDDLNANHRFEITSPSAVAAVRGTRFSMSMGQNYSEVKVYEGRVSMRKPRERDFDTTYISKGQKLSIHKDKPRSKDSQPLSDQDWAEYNKHMEDVESLRNTLSRQLKMPFETSNLGIARFWPDKSDITIGESEEKSGKARIVF